MSLKVIFSSRRPALRWESDKPVFFSTPVQDLKAVSPLVSGAIRRMASAACLPVASEGRPWLLPGASTVPSSAASSAYSSFPDQTTPLEPMPTLWTRGPRAVIILWALGKSRVITDSWGMVRPGMASVSPLLQSATSAWAISPGLSCISGVATRSFASPRCTAASSENFSAMAAN